MKRLLLGYPLKGFGTAEVGIALALVAIFMISFLVLGSHWHLSIDNTPAPSSRPSEMAEAITLRVPN